MKVEARLTFDKFRHDQSHDAHLVVSLTAPALKAAEDKRQSLCIIPVIDVSPSMIGPKFEYAKRSILKLIDHLAPGDYCGLIQFSQTAEVIAMPTKVSPETKDDLKRKVGDLQIGNATNIAGAMLKGLEIANKMDLSASVLTRVILFTDGEANCGPAVRPDEILELVEPNLGLASLSAFGYGTDAQQTLLSDMAKHGKGNYAFVQNPDDALSAFGKELGGLLSTYATDLVVDLKPVGGHEITAVISDVDAQEKEDIGGEVQVRIPDLLAEETRHLVFGVKLAEQKNSFPRATSVFDVEVGYDTLSAAKRKEHNTESVKAKVRFVKPGEEQEKATPELDQIVGLAQVVRAQIEAEQAAKVGDWTAAYQKVQSLSSNLKTRGLVGVSNIAAKVASHFGSAGAYTSGDGQAYLASVSRGMTRGMGGSYCLSAMDDLASVGVNMANSAQGITSSSFASDDPGPEPQADNPNLSWSQILVNPDVKVDLSPFTVTADTSAPPSDPAPSLNTKRSDRW